MVCRTHTYANVRSIVQFCHGPARSLAYVSRHRPSVPEARLASRPLMRGLSHNDGDCAHDELLLRSGVAGCIRSFRDPFPMNHAIAELPELRVALAYDLAVVA